MNGKGKSILVAEEDQAGCLLEKRLTTHHSKVVAVTDGLQALRELHNGHFDVVITDVHLPYFDGLDLLSQCHLVWPELPVVLLSGHSPEIIEPAVVQGAYAGLPKPINIGKLIYILKEAIARHASQAVATRMT